jgi:hypothetical protein
MLFDRPLRLAIRTTARRSRVQPSRSAAIKPDWKRTEHALDSELKLGILRLTLSCRPVQFRVSLSEVAYARWTKLFFRGQGPKCVSHAQIQRLAFSMPSYRCCSCSCCCSRCSFRKQARDHQRPELMMCSNMTTPRLDQLSARI